MNTDPGTGRAPDSFLRLLEVHEALDGLFAAHQEALLDRDLARAARLLREFTAAIREHIVLEEDVLLPIYARAERMAGGDPQLYLAEHRKILQYLNRFQSLVDEMTQVTPEAHAIIEVLDEEVRFKDLMEHHDLRERNILYPVLDKIATDAERMVLRNAD